MATGRKSDFTLPTFDSIFSTQEQRDDAKLAKIRDIPLSEIDDFPDHPFKVRDDEDMVQLVESIKERGVITPATVRQKEDGRYELISGHRRKRASELAGFETLRCEVVDLTREEATILMVESNFQRSQILPSEKAFAYKMRLEAMNKQAGRPKKENSTPVVSDFEKVRSNELLGAEVGESREQIRRYIRLTELVPELLEYVDEGRIKMRPAVELSYLDEDSGLCCASYVSYVYYNYLPNIAGVDTSTSPCPSNPRSANAYNEQANSWIANGTARRISFTQASNGDNFNPSEEIPIGSLIVFEHMETGRIAHVALYAGYYNGNHFVTHVGNERGPEFSTIVGMSKGGYPEAVVQVVVPDFVEENGAIEVHKKDTDGKNLSGAVFVATNKDTGKQYKIGPTNSKGYAITSEGIPYGTYSVKETVFPTNYRSYGKTEWTVTVSSSNNGVVSFDAVNEIIPGSVKIIKTSEDGKVDGISFTISGNGVNKTVTTNSKGEVQVDELKPGTYTVTEKAYDKYEPQEVRTVNVVTGKVSSVAFSNVLKRGDLQVIKSSEDNFVKGMTFHLYGTSLSGIKVDEYATTNANGIYCKEKK